MKDSKIDTIKMSFILTGFFAGIGIVWYLIEWRLAPVLVLWVMFMIINFLFNLFGD